jgi:subtilisin-like proprotein convertase family protein
MPAGPRPRRPIAESLERRVLLATITGRVFHDTDVDAVSDATEPGIAGWRVYLDNNNSNTFDAEDPSTLTDASGVYSFIVRNGTFRVHAVRLGGSWGQTLPAAQGGYTVNVTLGNLTRVFDEIDFGEATSGLVSGVKFHDVNRNGVRDGSEAGLAGWTIYADANNNNQFDPGEQSTLTGIDGGYVLTVDAAGTADNIIREVQRVEWIPTVPAGPAGYHAVNVHPGHVVTGVNFGDYRAYSLSGTVFNDVGGDGARSAGDPGVPGWTVYLDESGNRQLDTATATATATTVPADIAFGLGTTSGLNVAGLSGVILDVDVTLGIAHPYDSDVRVSLWGPSPTHPGSSIPVELFTHVGGAGDNFSNTTLDDEAAAAIADGGAPFVGSYRPAGLLSAFDGASPNAPWSLSIRDDAAANNGTLLGWSLTITYGDARRVTDAQGAYSFNRLSGANYTVAQVDQAGWVQTAPALRRYVAGGGDRTNLDFGNVRNAAPAVGSLSAAPEPIVRGMTGTLIAGGVTDPDGDASVSGVTFYRESNGTPGLQSGAGGDTPLMTDGSAPYAYAFPTAALAAGDYTYYAQAADVLGATSNVASTRSRVVTTGVVARHVFYNRSAFDGADATANVSDDGAIATDKRALLPGQAASFANVTSYSRGINGVMIDVLGLPAASAPAAGDFDFGGAPPPASVSVRRGAGVGASDRVTLTWPDFRTAAPAAARAVANGWLRVTVKATAATGLETPDVFSLGNLIGETGDGRRGAWAVNAIDLAGTRAALGAAATITGASDFDRDGAVRVIDVALARANHGRMLLPPAAPPAVVTALSALPPRGERDEAYPLNTTAGIGN